MTQRAVGIDNIEAFDGDLTEILRLRRLSERRHTEHDDDERARDGVRPQEEELTANRLTHRPPRQILAQLSGLRGARPFCTPQWLLAPARFEGAS